MAITFIISIPTSEIEKKSKSDGQIKEADSKIKSISLKNNNFNNQNESILEAFEKSREGSKEAVDSTSSKSADTASTNSGSPEIQRDNLIDKPLNANKKKPLDNPKKNRSYEYLVDTNDDSQPSHHTHFIDSDYKDSISYEDSTMEDALRDTLKQMNVINAAWILTAKKNFYQIIFTMDSTIDCENFLRKMNEWGIGEREGTSITIVPCTLFQKQPVISTNEDNTKKVVDDKETLWERFMFSIKARLNVATIVEEVKESAKITFDYVTLIVVASTIAAFGLLENSIVCLTASMLVSPLMGPIMAGIFGTVINDRNLSKMGVVNELFGIGLATFVGFIFGFMVCALDSKLNTGGGATSEMLSRCEWRSLVIGIFTAIPSGAAVALAILSENTGSLVGVAISASLLPPAVNAGFMWSLSAVYAIFQHDDSKYNQIVMTNRFSDHQAVELLALGTVSMGLTLINIACIYVMGVIFLKIKEVAPINSPNQREFWKHDIKIARDYYKTCQSEDAATLSKKLVDEIARHEGGTGYRPSISQQPHSTWSPITHLNQYTMVEGVRPQMQELESMYHTITSHSSKPISLRKQSLTGKSLSPPLTNHDIKKYLHHDPRRTSYSYDHPTFHPSSLPLGKIVENIQYSNSPNDAQVNIDVQSAADPLLPNDGTRKFIVTPAIDPLKKK